MPLLAASVLSLSNVKLIFSTSPWWYVFTALLAVMLAWVVYRFTIPPVSRIRKTILWILRGLALCIVILLLFEPVLAFLLSSERRPVVAVLADRSASMSIEKEGGESRGDQVTSFLLSHPFRNFEKKYDVRCFAFADSVENLSPDSLGNMAFAGVGSNLVGAWTRVGKSLSTENLAAIMLISDGAYNLGENPARSASVQTVPIFAVGVGDTSESSDAIISEILTNEIAYKGSMIPMDVRIRAIGLKNKSTTLRLIGRNGMELDRQVVHFGSDNAEVSVSMSFKVEDSGDLRITALLDSVAGESMIENNRRSVIIRVLDRKTGVLLFAGPPSADLTILRQVLDKDTTLEVTAYVEDVDGSLLYGKRIPSDEELAASNLIILEDFPTRNTTSSLIERIARVIEEKRIPIFVLAGSHVQASKLAAFGNVLPIHLQKAALGEQIVTVRSAAVHPALSGSEFLPVEWSDLPPVFGGAGNFTVDAIAQVALKLSRENLGVNEDEPALVFWQVSSRRGAAFLCWGISRWQLQLAESSSGANFYRDLMQRIRAWLVAPAEEKLVRIHATKKLYSGGEDVRFVGEVYGSDLSPRDDAAIEINVASGSRNETVMLRNRGGGRYEGEMTPWGEGEYRFRGSAVANADTLGSDQGLFAVEAFNIEFLDTRAHFEIMRKIAEASGGVFVPLSKADSLLGSLNFAPREITQRREAALWNRGYMIWLIILLLSLEWIIRKRSGML